MSEEKWLEPAHSKVEMNKEFAKPKDEKDILKKLLETQVYVKELQKKFGENKPLIDKIDVNPGKSLILQVLWTMVKSPVKTVRYIYYFVKLITGAKAMWETIKLAFTVNFKTTISGIVLAVITALTGYWQTGELFAEPLYVILSVFILIIGIVLPDMGWLKKTLQELAESAKKKKDE